MNRILSIGAGTLRYACIVSIWCEGKLYRVDTDLVKDTSTALNEELKRRARACVVVPG
jgi:hypothetical protein